MSDCTSSFFRPVCDPATFRPVLWLSLPILQVYSCLGTSVSFLNTICVSDILFLLPPFALSCSNGQARRKVGAFQFDDLTCAAESLKNK